MRYIFTITLPVFMGYIPLGMAYAILAANAGFSFSETILASVVIYAGAGQFLLVALIEAGASFAEVCVASFFVNFRHFFYTLSLLPMLQSMNRLKHYAIFALTDESFAIISSQKEKLQNLDSKETSKFIFLICLLNHFYWILGAALGFLCWEYIKIDYSGIEFSLNALFVVLFYELYRQNPQRKILLVASLISILALFFIDKSYMIISCLFISIILLFIGRKYVK